MASAASAINSLILHMISFGGRGDALPFLFMILSFRREIDQKMVFILGALPFLTWWVT
jgi:hypothetical protein